MKLSLTYIVYRGEKFHVAENLEYGVVSQGETANQAVKNLREALELFLEDEQAERLPVNDAKLGKLVLAQ